jgi:Rieske Fe-S protein
LAGEPRGTRRGFLGWFLGTSLGALCVSVLYPVVRYVIPPEVPESEAHRVVAAREGDLKPGEGVIFRFGSRPGLLVRLQDGSYRAFEATCTHLNCTVQYRADLGQIWCACHNGLFDLTGKNVAGPPPRPLEQYEVNVVEGDVVVSKA